MANKLSLFDAAAQLSNLLELADNPEALHESLHLEISAMEGAVSDAIDRRKYIIAECDARLEAAKKMTDQIKEHVKRLKKTKEEIKKSTIESMKVNKDVAYQDSLGRKVFLKKSSGAVKYNFELHSTGISNCVHPKYVADKDIRPYIVQRTCYQIDTQQVNEDLKNGKELPFAELIKKDIIQGL